MFKTLAIGAITAALVFGNCMTAFAAPTTARPGSTRPPTPAGKDDSVAQRPVTDRKFLRASTFDNEPRPTQDAAIALAHTQCRHLDTAGNTTSNRFYLAEQSRPFVEFPYLFLSAAIDHYCPRHTVLP